MEVRASLVFFCGRRWSCDWAENVVVRVRAHVNPCSLEVNLMAVTGAMNALQEGGQRSSGKPSVFSGRGLRHVDLTPVVFQAEDGQGYTKDVRAECWTANNGSARSFRLEQTQRRKMESMEVNPLGDCWVETEEVHGSQ